MTGEQTLNKLERAYHRGLNAFRLHKENQKFTPTIAMVGRIILVSLFYIVLSVWVMGANPLRGETSAPMDLLLAHSGWATAPDRGDVVTHPERSDILDVFIPQWSELKRDLKAEGSGLWIASAAGGRPGILDLSRSALTPSFLLFYLFEEDWLGFYFASLVKLVIAGLGTFLFLRHFIGPVPALFGGAVFALCGFHSAWFYWPHVTTSVWIPWVLWAVAGWNLYLKARWSLAIVLTTMMLILGGMPAVAAYGLYVVAFLALCFPFIRKPPQDNMFRALLVPFLSIGIAFLLCSSAVYGLYEVLIQIDLTKRLEEIGTAFASWRDLWLFINPYPNGLPRVEKTLYTGWLALLFAAVVTVSFFVRRYRGSDRHLLVMFGLVVFVGSVVIAFSMIPHEVIRAIPGVGSSLFSRTVVITGLGLAILAAAGLQMVLDRVRDLKRSSVRLVMFGVVLCVMVLQIVDQTILFRKFNAVAEKGQFYPVTPSLAYVQANLKPLQSVIADSSFLVAGTLGTYGIPEWFAHDFKTNAEKELLRQVVNNPFRTSTASVFDLSAVQLRSQLMDKLAVAYVLGDKTRLQYLIVREQQHGAHKPAPPLPANQFSQIVTIERDVSISAVSFVLATYDADKAPADVVLRLVRSDGRLIATSKVDAGSVKNNKVSIFPFEDDVLLKPGIYEFEIGLSERPATDGPLTAWYVDKPMNQSDQVRINGQVQSGAMLYQFLVRGDKFDKGEWEVLDKESDIVVLKNMKVPAGAYFVERLNDDAEWSDGKITTTRLHSDHIRIVYSGTKPGYVVLPMRKFPGWQATIGGKHQDVVTYMNVLPAVYVAGPSELEFIYRPQWFGRVSLLTAGGLVALVLMIFLLKTARWRRRSNKIEL